MNVRIIGCATFQINYVLPLNVKALRVHHMAYANERCTMICLGNYSVFFMFVCTECCILKYI